MITPALLSKLRSIDWDFTGALSDSPFSAIHFHPGRFASQVPATLIGLLTRRGDCVLDPFMGSGTTLVEAQRLDRVSIGVDLNPIAVLSVAAKTIPLSAQAVVRDTCEIERDVRVLLGDTLPIEVARRRGAGLVPGTVQAAKWYAPRVLADLAVLWELMSSYEGHRATIGRAAFSAILLNVCRETRHWGYVCDNTTPVSERAADVLTEFCSTLQSLAKAYRDRDEDRLSRFGADAPVPAAVIRCGDAVTELRKLANASVNMVLTSPPYFGVCDYVKAQRLSMEWFGYDIEPLRLNEVGARSKRHRLTAVQEYIGDLGAVVRELYRCLKPGGKFALLLGESERRAPVLHRTRRLLTAAGFHVTLDLNRTVSMQRRLTPSITGEQLFILEK
jgi:SAM-dependent methyltransferase